jgi:hypothetical protein
MSMRSRHDSDNGYVIFDPKTRKQVSKKVYKTCAGAQRSNAWKTGNVHIVAVDCIDHYYG